MSFRGRRARLGHRHQPPGDPRPAPRPRRDRGRRRRLRQAGRAGARAGARRRDRDRGRSRPASYADREARDAAIGDWLDGLGVDLVVLAGYMQLLSAGLRRALRRTGSINVHPALLPSFPGPRRDRPGARARRRVTGVTVHFVDEGVDSGPIILQRPVPVPPDRDRDALEEAIHATEHALLPGGDPDDRAGPSVDARTTRAGGGCTSLKMTRRLIPVRWRPPSRRLGCGAVAGADTASADESSGTSSSWSRTTRRRGSSRRGRCRARTGIVARHGTTFHVAG